MAPQIERLFIFVFRMFSGELFFYASLSDEMLNPRFVATHVVPIIQKSLIFNSLFSFLSAPNVAPVIGFLVIYGHLLIGLSLLSGLMVRVSASFGIVLMVLYWLAVGIQPLDLHVVDHASVVVPLVLAYRIVMNLGGTVFDIHLLWCVIFVYLMIGRAGHVWGLDAWAVRLPLFARHRGLRALVA